MHQSISEWVSGSGLDSGCPIHHAPSVDHHRDATEQPGARARALNAGCLDIKPGQDNRSLA
jgi:hypothetical protein